MGAHRLTLLLLASVTGAWLQLQQAGLWPLWAYALCLPLGMVALVLGWRAPPRLGACLVALGAAAMLFGLTGTRAVWQAGQALAPGLQGQDIELTGTVASLPRRGEQGWAFDFEVQSASSHGRDVTVPQRVRLSWRTVDDEPEATKVRPGQRWRWTVRLRRPHGLFNPHGFDAELWMWEQGLGATGYVKAGRKAAPPQLLEQTWAYPMEQARQRARDALLARVDDERAAGVMVALLAGDQASITQEDWNTFRLTGVAHLVSVSGTHVTMFATLAVWLVGGLWRVLAGVRPALLWRVPVPVAAGAGGVALAALYALFAGWGVPAQRTVLMLATVVALRLSARRWPWPMVWLLAMNVVVCLDPWALLQPGFWLSFVAVGVLFASAWSVMEGAGGWRTRLWELLRTQAVVTVALTPLTLLLFGQVSLVGLLANLAAIPWVTLLVTPLAMLGVLLPWLWTLGAWTVQAMLHVLEAMAAWPGAAMERAALPQILALLAVAGGVLLVLRLPWGWRAWGALLAWPALVYQPPRPPQGGYEALAADVGQGSAIIVRTATHTLLFDTGPPMGAQADTAQRVLLPWLRALGDRPDMVVVSHDDIDHSGGLPTLATAYPKAEFRTSFDTGERTPIPAVPCVAGERWVWDGVPFEFLHPQAGDEALGWSDNALSCVLLVGEGDTATLLTGDIPMAQETRLALQRPDLRAAWLVAAHHGSKTSSGPVWLNTVQPRWAVVQAGYRNRYGHPAPVVVRRFEARGIEWVNTADCGAATWRSWAPAKPTCYREAAGRYWNDRPASDGDEDSEGE